MWRAREEVTLARRGGGESVPRPGEVDVPSPGRNGGSVARWGEGGGCTALRGGGCALRWGEVRVSCAGER